MPAKSDQTAKIMNILRELPPAKVNEVIDFAEYLKSRSRKKSPGKQAKTALPTYHLGAVSEDAFDRASLYGDRLDSSAS